MRDAKYSVKLFPDIHPVTYRSCLRCEPRNYVTSLKILNTFIFFKLPVRDYALENKSMERLVFLIRPWEKF